MMLILTRRGREPSLRTTVPTYSRQVTTRSHPPCWGRLGTASGCADVPPQRGLGQTSLCPSLGARPSPGMGEGGRGGWSGKRG